MVMDARQMEILNPQNEKILVIQTAFIGDAILTLPMVQVLKKKYPHSYLAVLCIPVTSEIFNSSNSVDEVIIIDKKAKDKSFFRLTGFIKSLQEKSFTKIYSPHRSLRTSLIVMSAGVEETYGFDNAALKHVYKYLITYRTDYHEVRRNIELAGISTDEDNWKIKPEIIPGEYQLQLVSEFLDQNDLHGFVTVAPGSVWATKRFPADYFAELIEYLISIGKKVVLTGSKEEFDLCEYLRMKVNGSVINSAGKFSVAGSVELLKNSSLLISNDSAPVHMGMAADIPVLTIYCSTIPEFGFYPYNNKSLYISYNDLKCKPCGIHGHSVCPIETFDCARKLNTREIITLLNNILDENDKE